MMPSVGPAVLDGWMQPFRCHFTAAVWRHVLVLVCGALLAPGRRTVAAALRVMGLGEAAGFAVYHRVLSHGHWCSRALAHRLLLLLVAAFVPHGPVVVGLDDTIERRRGACIARKGIYRDPVRSSRGHFVKASGLRWLSVMLLAPVPWAGCVWGLPFLTVLAPSERYAAEQGKRHKKLTDWGRQALLQVARWLPGRRVVAVADSSFSAIALLRDLAPHLTVVTRLRLDACLCDPPPPRRPRQARATAGHRSAAAQPGRAPAQPAHALAQGQHRGLVRPRHAPARHRLRHRALASPRPAGGDPLGAGARPERREGAAGLPLHRSQGRSGRHPALVRSPLANRDHIRRGPSAPRRRNPAAVVRPGHPAHHAGAARPVLPRGIVGQPTCRRARTGGRVRALVSQAAADLQRRSRAGPARTLDRTAFSPPRRQPGQRRMPRPISSSRLLLVACRPP